MIFQLFRDPCGKAPASHETFERRVFAVRDLCISQTEQELLVLTVKPLLDALVQLGQLLASRRFTMESQVERFHVVVHVVAPFRFCNTNNYHTFGKKATTIFLRRGLLFFGYAAQFLQEAFYYIDKLGP